MIFRNSNNDDILLTIRSIVPESEMSQNVSRLLNGSWHVQTIGTGAEVLMVEGIGDHAVLDQLNHYFTTKERLTLEYLTEFKSVIIKEQPYSSLEFGGPNPHYSINLEMAVMPDV